MDDKPQESETNEAVSESPKRVYLAGACTHVEDRGKRWREQVKDEWGWVPQLEWVDPVAELEYDPEEHTSDYVVEHDKGLIDTCDAILVGLTDARTVGTWREVEYAISVLEIPVVIWTGTAPLEMHLEKDPFSPWAEEAGLMGSYLDDLIDTLLKELVTSNSTGGISSDNDD